MKAIVNIKNKKNQYSKYNGLTFEVGDLMNTTIGLYLTDDTQTDFHFSEVIIVDLQKEFNSYDAVKTNKLKFYALTNSISSETLINNNLWS